MAVQAGEAYVPIRADLSHFGKDVEAGVSKGAAGSTSKLKSLGGSIGGLVAAGAAASFAKSFLTDSIGGARESQAIANQTAQAIKTTGSAAGVTAEQVGDLSSKLSQQTAVDDELIQSGANLLLTFRNIRNEAGEGNDVFDQSVAIANDLAVALGTDMKSASLQVGKALNDPIKGVTALGRAGVQFTAEQKEQIKTMVESGDTLGAQQLILKELETQVGGSAAAQADAGKRMSIAWGNFQETIGALVIPMIDKLLGVITPLAQWASEHPGVLLALAAVIGGAVVAALAAWVIGLAATAGTAIVAAGGVAAFAASTWAAVAATLAAAAPVIAIVAAVAALAAGIVWAYKNVDIFRTAVDAVAQFITGTVWPAIQAGVDVFLNLGETAGSVFGALKSVVRSAVNYILDQLDKLLGPLGDIAGTVGGVVGKVGGLVGKIPGLATGGTITSSGLTWVGENGPELLRLPRAATVIPLGAGALGSGAAGAGGTNVFNIYNPEREKASDTIISAGRRAASLMGGG